MAHSTAYWSPKKVTKTLQMIAMSPNITPVPFFRPRITRGQGDWLGLTSYDSFIRYLSPACADAPRPRLSHWPMP